MKRRAAALALCAAAALATGCGNKHSPVTEAETEGIWVDVGSLDYHVQGSRILEEGQVPDDSYLTGVPEYVPEPKADEIWFAVWLRIENKTDGTATTAEEYEIVDTEETVFRPVDVDPALNPFILEPTEMPPNTALPQPDSTQELNSVAGAQLLFKIPLDSYQNRPLEFKIIGGEGDEPAEAVINLDV